jgi:DNA-binding response OmpR family regulator
MVTPTSSPRSAGPTGPTFARVGGRDAHWRPRVLVAEDDEETRRAIVGALTHEGFVVSEARNSAELIEIATLTRAEDGSPPELLITDVRAPAWGGIEALRALRPTLEGCVVLVITAFCDDALRDAAAEVGAAAVLDKPFDLGELRQTVSALLR